MDDTKARMLINDERTEQQTKHGFTTENDISKYKNEELLRAAHCYALAAVDSNWLEDDAVPPSWPWEKKWWRPHDQKTALIKCGALAQAHMDTVSLIDRMSWPANDGFKKADRLFDWAVLNLAEQL